MPLGLVELDTLLQMSIDWQRTDVLDLVGLATGRAPEDIVLNDRPDTELAEGVAAGED